MLKAHSLLLTVIFLFISLLICTPAHAMVDYSPTHPDLSDLNSNISSPEQYLGYPLGEWHLRHDQLNAYLKLVASQSPRVSIENTGVSHQQRQQLTAVVTSAENQRNLNKILAQRSQTKQQKDQQGPLVIWLAYSIHGDEASGSHAAMALLHYLSASKAPWVKQLLDEAVVLITPSQNPDGMDRFATWANDNRSFTKVLDPQTREHNQNWPKGRGNHYLADLNRDWLFLRHSESQGRVALFHKWQPHYLGDFHEMGSNSSYFFQPGAPERTHPLTPKANTKLTKALAKYHQQALDQLNQHYFSEQVFDDFFYGKGSTYPDINGAIGVLFEQASARGQYVATKNGEVSLDKAITNQFATSISSLKGALALKQELIAYQADFYHQKQKQQHQRKPEGYLVQAKLSPSRIDELANILSQHQVMFYYLNTPVNADDKDFAPETSLFIPTQQAQRDLILALFDKRTEFKDTSFYDISSWDLSAAFNLELVRNIKINRKKLTQTRPSIHFASIPESARTLLIDWRQDNAAPMLQQLLASNIRVKYALKPFVIESESQVREWPRGTLQIPLHQQQLNKQALLDLISELAKKFKISVASVTTSHSNQGIDLGSFDFKSISPIRPILVTGRGSRASEVGEIRYFLDRKLGVPLSLIDANRLSKLRLSEYTHIIFAGGDYQFLNEIVARKLGQFVSEGGVIIAQKGALNWLSNRHILRSDIKQERYFSKLFNGSNLTYDQQDKFEARQEIGGAIVNLKLDLSHPLSLGLTNASLPVLKDKALSIANIGEAFITAAKYQDPVLRSGFLAQEYQRELPNSPAIILEPKGKGAVIGFADNLLFRNFWLAGEKVFANALYFGQP